MKSRGRILIADDEPTFLNSTAELLRREGYDVETVEDAPSAVKAISDASFDLLITDLEMPGNADLDLVQQIANISGGCRSSSSPAFRRCDRRWRASSCQ